MIEFFRREQPYSYSQARKHPRFAADFLVKVRTTDQRLSDRVRNLSEGGIAIETRSPLSPMTLVSLSLDLPTEPKPIDLVGRVMWATDSAMGVRFEQSDARVIDCVDHLAKECERL
jgi:uncharacterized protein (TIGR02266 family)